MAAKTLLCAIATCLISSCAETKGILPHTRCTGPECEVHVKVTSGIIEADPPTLRVARGNSPNLFWELQAAGYEFAENGIVFESGSPIERCQKLNKTRFKCFDRNEKEGPYKYTITLIPQGGSPSVDPLDPIIYNE